MSKKVYNITGFDCAHCAMKTEKHLNKHPAIESCIIDFAGNKLHIEYSKNELSIDEIKKIIAEVETDPIEITEINTQAKKYKIFDKYFWFDLIRTIIATSIILVCSLVLKAPELYYYLLGIYTFGFVLLSYDIFYKVFKHIFHKESPLDEYLLIAICVLGAYVVAIITSDPHMFMEGLMVVTLFQVGKLIEGIATNKSKEAVMKAVNLRVDIAHLKVGSEIKTVDPESLKIGDTIVVTTGELIPVDSIVLSGDAQIDTSSLTGEFVPVVSRTNMEVYSGCLIKEGTLTLKVIRSYENSAVSKIIELISNSGAKKSKADEFVTKFARWYTPSVLLAAILVGVIGGLVTSNWYDWTILGLKMLIVACPCAIVISVPLAYFAALGLASKNGIVVKGTNYLDKLNEIKKVVSDKTGTLTKGSFEITKIVPNEISENELMDILCSVESLSNHPIGKTIANYKKSAILSENFREIAGFGVSAEYDDHLIFAGNARLMQLQNISIFEPDEIGTIIYVSCDDKFIGYVVVSDEIKEESKYLISSLNKMGIETVLLTGDKEENTALISQELGIKKHYSELLPEEKNQYLEKELSPKYATGYIGDGINDAASIKRADVGFAMGAIGSDAAIESADVVIMNDNPAKVVDAIKIAKIARHTSVFNIVVALTIKIGMEIAAIITSSLGHTEYIPMWAAVLADTGLTVALVINSLLILYRKIKHKSE